MKTKTIITEIEKDDLVNLFSTALYGSYIFGALYDKNVYNTKCEVNEHDCFEDKLAKVLLAGYSIVVYDKYCEGDDEFYGALPHTFSDDGTMHYDVTLNDIRNGLQLALGGDNAYLAKCANDLIHIDDSDFDLEEAEALMQYIVFGELIYG